MKNAKYLVIPEAGNPHGYFLINREKDLKLYVKKAFKDEAETAFHYQFFYIDSKGHTVSKAAYKSFSYRKGITETDNKDAATWFLTNFFSYRHLYYNFPECSSSKVSGHYPVLGRHFPKSNILNIVSPLYILSTTLILLFY
jgi:hypothetical protein